MDRHSHPAPKTRISGDGRWPGWWVPPLVLIVLTVVLIAAAVAIQGPGQDSGSPAAGQTAAAPAATPPER